MGAETGSANDATALYPRNGTRARVSANPGESFAISC